VRFWQSTIGERPLRMLKTGDVLAAIATKPNLSGKTVNNYTSVLREALQLAVIDALMHANPMDHVAKAKWQKLPIDPFTRDEAEAIIQDAAKHHPGQIANLIEWWMWSGVRTSEMAGLHWSSVDLATGHMRIAEAMVRGVEKQSTKTNKARDVRLNSRALAAITRQKAHTVLAGEHVWTDPRYGTSWSDERAFRRSYWTPILKRLGIRYRRPYNMRHTYATTMLMAGMAPAYCAGQLGHSVEIFLSTYATWLPGAGDVAEMGKLERAMSDSSLINPTKAKNDGRS
jgi:integrase